MHPFDKFPLEIAMQIVKMTPHPVADILQTSWREDRARIKREMAALRLQAVGKPKRKRKSKFRTFAGAACFDWAPVKPKSQPT